MGTARFIVATTACLAACGGLLGDDFDAEPTPETNTDASTESGANDDAPTNADGAADGGGGNDGARCDPDAAFGKPTLFGDFNTNADESNAALSADELELYLVRGAAANLDDRDIYHASRTTVDMPFDTPSKLSVNDSFYEEDNASVSADGLMLAFHSARNAGNLDVYVATRPVKTVDWQTVSMVGAASTNAEERDPYLTPNKDFIFFGLGITTSNFDLYYVTLPGFTGPQSVGVAINDAFNQSQPVVRRDLGEMFFAGDQGTQPFLRVWHAPQVAGGPNGFRNAEHLTALDGDGTADVPTWISDDGCILLLSSDRSAGKGGRDIYIARRP